MQGRPIRDSGRGRPRNTKPAGGESRREIDDATMKMTLYRYLIKEQMVPLGVCLMGVSLVLITGRLFQLLKVLFTSSFTLGDLMALVALAMPKLMLFALPMASLLGVLLAFVRLNSDNELIALRAAGIGFHQFFPAVVSLLLGVTLISFVNMIFVIPPTGKAFEVKLRSMARSGLPLLMKEGTFITAIPQLTFFFQSVNPTELSVRGIFVQDRREEKVRLAIVAESARIVYQRNSNHLTFKIANGSITRVADDMKNAQAVSFKAYDLSLSLDELIGSARGSKMNKREMTLRELYRVIVEKTGDIGHALEFHQRLAFPSGCLLLGLIGAPLGAVFRQRGRIAGITIGLVVFLAYYVILSAGKGLGENHLVHPFLACWAPNLLCIAASFYLWRKMRLETPFKTFQLLQEWASSWYRLRRARKGKKT